MSEKDPHIALETEPAQEAVDQAVDQYDVDPRTVLSRSINRVKKAIGRDHIDDRGRQVVSLRRGGVIGSTTTISDGYVAPFNDETMKVAIDYLYASDDA